MARRGRVNPGQLRDEITLKVIVRTPDGGGGFTRADTDETDDLNPGNKIWASMTPYNGIIGAGQEVFREGQLQPRATHKAIIRYRNDVKQGQYFVFDGRDFYIMYARDPDERKEYLHLYCREGGPT